MSNVVLLVELLADWQRVIAGLKHDWHRAIAGLKHDWHRAIAGLKRDWHRVIAGLKRDWHFALQVELLADWQRVIAEWKFDCLCPVLLCQLNMGSSASLLLIGIAPNYLQLKKKRKCMADEQFEVNSSLTKTNNKWDTTIYIYI